MQEPSPRSYSSTLWLLAAIVLLWRIAAYLVPDEGPEGWLRLALAGLGLLFVACGLFAYRQSSSRAALLFALYALCSGLHWGGPIGSLSLAENPLLLGGYLVFSSILGEALFLHFALEFSPAWRSRLRRWIVLAMYLPTAVAFLLVPIIVLVGSDQRLGELATTGLVLSYKAVSYFAYVALAVFALRVYRSRRKAPATVVLIGTVVGALPYLLHTSGVPLPGPADAYNLFFGLMPIAGVVALGLKQDVRTD